MYDIGRTPLARLRPEKLDDMALKEQISIVKKEIFSFIFLIIIYCLDSRNMWRY